jgi:SAM-dependent methyltransferase
LRCGRPGDNQARAARRGRCDTTTGAGGMPDLDSTIHLDMLERQKRDGEIYGMQWGNPETAPRFKWVRDELCLANVHGKKTALEIGPGGGRWTQYLRGFRKLYAVDYHKELLDELARNFSDPNIVPVHAADGKSFPGVPDGSIDFVFSFGTFVHLELDVIDGYLSEIRRVLKPTGRAVIQYADKNKPAAKRNKGFSQNSPQKMRPLVLKTHGFWIEWENVTAFNHSAVMQFSLRDGLAR